MREAAAAEELAAYLGQLKQRTGRSYSALARRLDVSSSALHRYCSGEGVPPHFSLLERFARECGADHHEMAELHRRWERLMAARHAKESSGSSGDRALKPDTRTMVSSMARLSTSQSVRASSRLVPAPMRRVAAGPASERKLSPDGDAPDPGADTGGYSGGRSPAGSGVRIPRGRRPLLLLGGAMVLVAMVALPVALHLGRDEAAPSGTLDAKAHPMDRCTEREGVRHVDRRRGGHVWTTDFVCPNRTPAPLYLDDMSSIKVSTMDTPHSWFVCWTRGREHKDGGDVWYYTQGDRNERGAERVAGWGFMAARDVSLPRHPAPGMPQCTFASTGVT